MKIVALPFILSAFALCLAGKQAGAQIGSAGSVLPSVTVNFAIPQSVDPARLTYTAFGTMYTHADAASPGDNKGVAITGNLLDPNIGGGLELHGEVPAPGGIGTTPVTEVDFFTNYTGTLTFTSTSAGSFLPWSYSLLPTPAGYSQAFRYYKTSPLQANLDDTNGSFGLLTATPSDPNNTAFLNSTFSVVGTQYTAAVPEPGAFALLGGLCVGGHLLWRRRGRRSI